MPMVSDEAVDLLNDADQVGLLVFELHLQLLEPIHHLLKFAVLLLVLLVPVLLCFLFFLL